MKKVAAWTYGGIGAGLFAQGYPMLVKLVSRLSAKHRVVIYSFVTVSPDVVPDLDIHCPPAWLKPSPLRWSYLVMLFVIHHIQRRYDVLLAFWAYPTGYLVTLLGRITNKPVIVNILGAELANFPDIGFGLLRFPTLRRRIFFTLRNARRVMTISRFQADIIASLGIDRAIEVIPWGADHSQFQFQEKSWEDLRILHVANLTEVKDQVMLLRCFATLRKSTVAKLVVVGGDFMNGKIQQLAKSLGIEGDIDFAGGISYEAIASYHRWANMMLHTSVYEGQSMAVTEGIASGLLIGGTRVGILYDLGNSATVAVAPGHDDELAAKILDAVRAPAIARSKIEAARQWSDTHDFEWTVREVDRVIVEASQS